MQGHLNRTVQQGRHSRPDLGVFEYAQMGLGTVFQNLTHTVQVFAISHGELHLDTAGTLATQVDNNISQYLRIRHYNLVIIAIRHFCCEQSQLLDRTHHAVQINHIANTVRSQNQQHDPCSHV